MISYNHEIRINYFAVNMIVKTNKPLLTHLPQFASIFHKIRQYSFRKPKDINRCFLKTICSAEKPLDTVL